MLKARALHYVLKIGDRTRMIQFLRDLLGMKVLLLLLIWRTYSKVILFVLLGASSRGIREGMCRPVQWPVRWTMEQDDDWVRAGG